jgi:hypothetical protein
MNYSYDVYTPTQNIVFHNYQPNADGHNTNEWMKHRRERLRQLSLGRIKSYLGLPGGIEGLNLSNLGIYGLGKRRTLQQLADFVGINLATQQARAISVSSVLRKKGKEWSIYINIYMVLCQWFLQVVGAD